jgi:hypothetical protein
MQIGRDDRQTRTQSKMGLSCSRLPRDALITGSAKGNAQACVTCDVAPVHCLIRTNSGYALASWRCEEQSYRLNDEKRAGKIRDVLAHVELETQAFDWTGARSI